MFGFCRKRVAQGRLARALADYPPWAPPHLGHVLKLRDIVGPMLTPAQAWENFVAYRAAVPERIAVLRPVLAEIGILLDQAYSDPAGYVRRLHPTLLTELPPLYRKELTQTYTQELSDRSGDAIVLSFLADLAMLSGDVMIRAKPGAFWGINLDRRERTKFSKCRPCLLGLVDRYYPNLEPQVFYLEEEYFDYYANMDRPSRLAPPEPIGGSWMDVIGGGLPARLERYDAAPDIARRRVETWMKDAA